MKKARTIAKTADVGLRGKSVPALLLVVPQVVLHRLGNVYSVDLVVAVEVVYVHRGDAADAVAVFAKAGKAIWAVVVVAIANVLFLAATAIAIVAAWAVVFAIEDLAADRAADHAHHARLVAGPGGVVRDFGDCEVPAAGGPCVRNGS